jgi:hypothetical protein
MDLSQLDTLLDNEGFDIVETDYDDNAEYELPGEVVIGGGSWTVEMYERYEIAQDNPYSAILCPVEKKRVRHRFHVVFGVKLAKSLWFVAQDGQFWTKKFKNMWKK